MASEAQSLTLAELYSQALHLERDIAARYRVYARRMREIGATAVAEAFEKLELEEQERSRALAESPHGGNAGRRCPWEEVWERAWASDASGQVDLIPSNPRQAILDALSAKKRAECFYIDVSDDAHSLAVRVCAAEFAVMDRRQMLKLQSMLAEQVSGIAA